jgi:pyruvate dehydrogenase E1 component beta subunit
MYTVPIGKANRLRVGDSLTVVASSLAAIHTLTACQHDDLDVDLIDLRTIKPLDEEMILQSVAKTGRLLVVDYDFPFAGVAAEICAMAAEQAFAHLRAAPQRLCFPDRGMPASGPLERAYYPTPARIAARIRRVIEGASTPAEVLA